MLPIHDFFFPPHTFSSFFISYLYGMSTEPGFVKTLLLRRFEGQPVCLPAGLCTPGWLAAGGGCCGKLLYHSAETNCSAVESVVSTLLFDWPGCFNQISHTSWPAVSQLGDLRALFSMFPPSSSLLTLGPMSAKWDFHLFFLHWPVPDLIFRLLSGRYCC